MYFFQFNTYNSGGLDLVFAFAAGTSFLKYVFILDPQSNLKMYF